MYGSITYWFGALFSLLVSKMFVINIASIAVSWREQAEPLFLVLCCRQPVKWRNAGTCSWPQDGIFPIHSTAPRWVFHCYFRLPVLAHHLNFDLTVNLLVNVLSLSVPWRCYGLDDPGFECRRWQDCSFQKGPDRLRSTPGLLISGYWGFFPGIKGLRHGVGHLHLVPGWRISRAVNVRS